MRLVVKEKELKKTQSQFDKLTTTQSPNAYEISAQFERSKMIHTRFKAKNVVPEDISDPTKRMLDGMPEKKKLFLARQMQRYYPEEDNIYQ